MTTPDRQRGPGNPPDSEWFSTPADRRRRKPFGVTLAPEERRMADELAKRHKVPLSRVVGAALAVLYDLPKARQAGAIACASELDAED